LNGTGKQLIGRRGKVKKGESMRNENEKVKGPPFTKVLLREKLCVFITKEEKFVDEMCKHIFFKKNWDPMEKGERNHKEGGGLESFFSTNKNGSLEYLSKRKAMYPQNGE